jgi:histidine ammonia-lyase
MPASVFSRSTECHNQDKVSLGTIAARDCLRVLDLTDQVVAAMLVAARQGIALRKRVRKGLSLSPRAAATYDALAAKIPLIEEDRALEAELRSLLVDIHREVFDVAD